jgi:hypothetical protein
MDTVRIKGNVLDRIATVRRKVKRIGFRTMLNCKGTSQEQARKLNYQSAKHFIFLLHAVQSVYPLRTRAACTDWRSRKCQARCRIGVQLNLRLQINSSATVIVMDLWVSGRCTARPSGNRRLGGAAPFSA